LARSDYNNEYGDSHMTRLRLILNTALCSVLLSPAAWPQSTTPAGSEAETASRAAALEEIVVTARKREETLADVPISITAFSEQTLDRLNIRDFNDFATQTPNLSFSYGTAELGFGGTRSPAIRGVSGEGTVGVYIDDTPVPDSIDPRVVDLARIEILKGPQGTLFGQGSLGGNLRMITVQPSASDPDIHFEARAGATSGGGSPDYGVNFAGSYNLIDDHLIARLVGFVDHTAGFLTRTYPDAAGNLVHVNNQGATFSYGGSLSLLWKLTDRLSITPRILYQMSSDYGWAAPYAPLPGFTITSLTLNRVADIQEGVSDHWALPSLLINYRGDGFTIVSSTNYFDRDILNTEDASEGTQWAFDNAGYLPHVSPKQPFPWNESIPQRSETNETRISFDQSHGFSGVAGIYISQQFSNEIDNGNYLPGLAAGGYTTFPGYCPGTPPCPTYGSDLVWYSVYPLTKLDEAAFGELYYEWQHWQFTAGLRYYKERQTRSEVNAGAVEAAYNPQDLGTATQHGVTPKGAVSYKISEDTMVYASAAKGFRAGGVGQSLLPYCGLLPELGLKPGEPTKYNADWVWNYEVGGKTQLAGGRMVLSAALFQMNWSNIQQNFTVPVCFLGITENEGAARSRGGEIELSGHPWESLDIRAGIGYVDARITEQGLPVLPPVGARIAQVPEATENFSATVTHPLKGPYEGFITGEVSHVGSSDSYTASLGHPLTRPGYTLVNGSMGVRWSKSELALYAANITNRHPNLGDLNPAGYVRHEDLSADSPIIPRVATLQPFNAGIQYRQRF
jgi:outer membrane receptor protein involved in Fe transport